MSDVEQRSVAQDEEGLRLDRWFRRHFPDLTHGRLQKLLRTGQVRVDGRRAESGTRLSAGQAIRIPPLGEAPAPVPSGRPAQTPSSADADFVRELVIRMDREVIAINKPPGLAVQGGTGTARHLDGMLDALRFDAPERPRLVHRLDKDTSGVMLLARTAAAAAALGEAFRGRTTRKIYWALVAGMPPVEAGTVDLPLAKLPGRAGEKMAVDREAGKRAITEYITLDRAGKRIAWLALWPRTGRTHQLRAHCAAIGTPILGDGKYGGAAAHADLPADLPGRQMLHLHARRIVLPHPSGRGTLDVSADLPPALAQSWAYFGFDDIRADDPFKDLD
ncbi:MAG: RluA family pseudouridine synthase [Alphaproteobacteria bacterium]